MNKEILENLEKKYGGLVQNVKRNIMSKYEKNYYSVHQGGDRMNSQYHNYSKYYSKFLDKYVNKDKINMAEVGILTGIGMAIWCDIFPKAEIYGLDIDTNIFKNNYDNLIKLDAFTKNKPIIHNFDQYLDNRNYIGQISNNKKFSIVIDDGCHLDQAIINTFISFLPYLEKEFVYFIEDNYNVHHFFRNKFPQFNVFYEDQMTIITNK